MTMRDPPSGDDPRCSSSRAARRPSSPSRTPFIGAVSRPRARPPLLPPRQPTAHQTAGRLLGRGVGRPAPLLGVLRSPVPAPVSHPSCQTTRIGHHSTLTEPWGSWTLTRPACWSARSSGTCAPPTDPNNGVHLPARRPPGPQVPARPGQDLRSRLPGRPGGPHGGPGHMLDTLHLPRPTSRSSRQSVRWAVGNSVPALLHHWGRALA
jgi:hypothetical protein